MEEGNPAQAAVVLERARRKAPGKGSILEPLGRSYFSLGKYPAAAGCFKEALEVDPTNDYAHFCLGLCYLKLKEKKVAAGHFKLAWVLKPCETYRDKASRFGA